MTTYTIVDTNSDIIRARGATAAEAAAELLSHDGHEYEVRAAEGGGHSLWVSRFSRNSACYDGLTRSVIYSPLDDAAEAEADIYNRVIASGHWTNPFVMTDAEHDAAEADRLIDDAAAAKSLDAALDPA